VGRVEGGFNVYGLLTANVGLGAVARNTITMLQKNGRAVRAVDLDPGGDLQGTDDSISELVAASASMERLAVNIFHINPDRLHPLIASKRHDLGLEGCFNLCVPFWEAPRLPKHWRPSLSAMDAVLAPSRFVRQAVAADLPGTDIFDFPQATYLPEGVIPTKERWGIPADLTVFVTSLAIASGIDRKNPWAAIEAFERAFAREGEAMLVIKVNNPDFPVHLRADAQRLRAACATRSDILLIEEPLSYVEVLSLYDSCDVFISLHRSEGLGLGLLESMSLGKPVIGTAWSGNMDFMTEQDSILVPYDLVDIQVPRMSPYHPRHLSGPAQWAEPDIESAAEWMARLSQDPDLRSAIGAAAKRRAEKMRSEFEAGEVLGVLDGALARYRAEGRRPMQVEALRRIGKTRLRGHVKRFAKTVYKRLIGRR